MSTNIQLGTFYVFDGHIHPIENVMLLQLTQKLIMDNIKVQILFTIDLQKKKCGSDMHHIVILALQRK